MLASLRQAINNSAIYRQQRNRNILTFTQLINQLLRRILTAPGYDYRNKLHPPSKPEGVEVLQALGLAPWYEKLYYYFLCFIGWPYNFTQVFTSPILNQSFGNRSVVEKICWFFTLMPVTLILNVVKFMGSGLFALIKTGLLMGSFQYQQDDIDEPEDITNGHRCLGLMYGLFNALDLILLCFTDPLSSYRAAKAVHPNFAYVSALLSAIQWGLIISLPMNALFPGLTIVTVLLYTAIAMVGFALIGLIRHGDSFRGSAVNNNVVVLAPVQAAQAPNVGILNPGAGAAYASAPINDPNPGNNAQPAIQLAIMAPRTGAADPVLDAQLAPTPPGTGGGDVKRGDDRKKDNFGDAKANPFGVLEAEFAEVAGQLPQLPEVLRKRYDSAEYVSISHVLQPQPRRRVESDSRIISSVREQVLSGEEVFADRAIAAASVAANPVLNTGNAAAGSTIAPAVVLFPPAPATPAMSNATTAATGLTLSTAQLTG